MNGHVDQLAAAIIEQAQRLAEQYHLQAQTNRERILREAREKLKLREDREVLIAKSMADRAYRRTVQSKELRLQARLDQLRWSLVTGGLDRLRDRLRELTRDAARYREVLKSLLEAGLLELPETPLLVFVNAADQRILGPGWAEFCGAAAERVSLAEQTIECLGGVLIETPDRRLRVDHTFEGRMRRLATPLAETIQAHLLPVGSDEASTLV